MRPTVILLCAILVNGIHGFLPLACSRQISTKNFSRRIASRHLNMAGAEEDDSVGLDPNTLMDMDIVIFSLKSNKELSLQLGAMQEDGTLAPLSAWTDEFAFGEMMEFLVDEEDRWKEELEFDNVIIHHLLREDVMSYGSRQVGGGKGPGNPHGEESELVYYIDSKVMAENSINVVLKPELELLW
jgi:hypothetical protein